jgi:hypothetical protein
MAEIIGGISAGLQIADGFLRLSDNIHRCIKTMANAPKEIRKFRTETAVFAHSLQDFHDVASTLCKDLDPQNPETRRMEQIVDAIITQAQEVRRGIKKLLRRVKDSRAFLRRLLWWLQQNSVAVLEKALSSVKLNVIMVVTTFNCKILLEKIKRLEKENKKVPWTLQKQMYGLIFFLSFPKLIPTSASLQKQLRTQQAVAKEERDQLHTKLVTNHKGNDALVNEDEMRQILSAEKIIERFVEKRVIELGLSSPSSRRTNTNTSDTSASGRRSSQSARRSQTFAADGPAEESLLGRRVNHEMRTTEEEVTQTEMNRREEKKIVNTRGSRSRLPSPQEEVEEYETPRASETINPIEIANSYHPERSSADSAELKDEIDSSESPKRSRIVGRVIYDDNQGSIQEVWREWRIKSPGPPTDVEETRSEHEEIPSSPQKGGKYEATGSNNSASPIRQPTPSSLSAQEVRAESVEHGKSDKRSRDVWEEMESSDQIRNEGKVDRSGTLRPHAPFTDEDKRSRRRPSRGKDGKQ